MAENATEGHSIQVHSWEKAREMARKLREGKRIGSKFDRTAILQKISWEKATEREEQRQENWLGLLTDHTRLGKNCCSLGEGGTIQGRYQGTITFMVVNSKEVKKQGEKSSF